MNNNDDNKSNLSNITDRDKFNAMLHNYTSLSHHIDLYIRTSYVIGFGTITATVTIAAFSFIYNQLVLFCAIPFILFIGAIIYAQVVYNLINHSEHRAKLEEKIKKITKSTEKLIDTETTVGLFKEGWVPYLQVGMVLFFTTAYLYLIIKSIEMIKNIVFTIIYISMIVILFIVGFWLFYYYLKKREKLKLPSMKISKTSRHSKKKKIK